jgi:hypothetical protein
MSRSHRRPSLALPRRTIESGLEDEPLTTPQSFDGAVKLWAANDGVSGADAVPSTSTVRKRDATTDRVDLVGRSAFGGCEYRVSDRTAATIPPALQKIADRAAQPAADGT